MKLQVTGIETIELQDPQGLTAEFARKKIPALYQPIPFGGPSIPHGGWSQEWNTKAGPPIMPQWGPSSTGSQVPSNPNYTVGVANSAINAGDLVSIVKAKTDVIPDEETFVMGLSDQFRHDLLAIKEGRKDIGN